MITYFGYLFKGSVYQQSLSVIVPAIVFSISHFYHGVKNMIKIFVLSVFLGFIFIQSGSLVIVMLLHFMINVIGGLLTIKYIGKKMHQGIGA
jgi:membrane protease YdiL (CAAX protease family)